MAPRSIEIRRASIADAPMLAETVRQGFDSYREWTPPGWHPPDPRPEREGIAERLARADTWCSLASDDGLPAGHVAFLQAQELGSPHSPIAGLAHLWMLFVRRDWWGTGLATRLLELAVAEAIGREYSAMRLFTPAGHARARAFYEREGWRVHGQERFEPGLDLELVEYRRPL